MRYDVRRQPEWPFIVRCRKCGVLPFFGVKSRSERFVYGCSNYKTKYRLMAHLRACRDDAVYVWFDWNLRNASSAYIGRYL